MADPGTIGTAGMTLSGAGTGLNFASKILGTQAASKQYLYKAGMADLNAKIAEQNAQWARTTGERENLIFGMKAGQRLGAIGVGQAASGIDVDSEGSRRVVESQRKLDQMDREQILSNAARKAYGHDVEAWDKRNQATMLREASSQVKKGGALSAAASLVGGATSVADKWYQGNTSGMWATNDETTSFAPAPAGREWRWDLPPRDK